MSRRRKAKLRVRSRNPKSPKRNLDAIGAASRSVTPPEPKADERPFGEGDHVQVIPNDELAEKIKQGAAPILEANAKAREEAKKEQGASASQSRMQRAEAVVQGRRGVRKVVEEIFKWGAGIKVLIELVKTVYGLFR